MALKFTEKLKGIDLCKGKESLSEVASSVSKLFDRKNRESTISNVKENIDVEYELENILEPTTQNIVKRSRSIFFIKKFHNMLQTILINSNNGMPTVNLIRS